MRKLLATVTLATLSLACDYHYRFETPTTPTTITPTTPTPNPNLGIVEFRVNGDLPFATVRVDNSIDGFSQTVSVLPYTSKLNLAGRDNVFLSISATGVGYGFLHAAIFVDGVMFREATSAIYSPSVAVTGTYRRGQ